MTEYLVQRRRVVLECQKCGYESPGFGWVGSEASTEIPCPRCFSDEYRAFIEEKAKDLTITTFGSRVERLKKETKCED